MTPGTAILWAASSIVVGGAAGTVAASLRCAVRDNLEDICRRRKSEPLADEIQRERGSTVLAAECLQALCNAVFLVAVALELSSVNVLGEADTWLRFAVIAASGGLLLVIFNVAIPSAIARVWGETYVVASWPLWRAVRRILAPVVSLARGTEGLIARLSGRGAATSAEPLLDGELRSITAEDQRDARLEEDAREMIEGVIQLGDAEVSQVMTPRTYMFSMPASTSLEEAVKFLISSGHTRIPVNEKSRDDIIGILHMKDLLPELLKPPQSRAQDVKGFLRPALFVPETKRLDELLQEFQQTRNHMAMVLDEYGGVSGLVTIEDVLEEIVGEIVDEYDEALVEEIKMVDERTAEVLARARIEDVNAQMGTHLAEEGEFDTIGGFVFSHLGHIPTVGESITVDDVRLTVTDATRRRIERVRVEVLDPTRSVKTG